MPAKTELKLWFDKSAEKWTEALPLGNAETGAMIYGKTDKEIIALNNDRLWSGLPDEQQNTIAKNTIPAARKLIDEGKYAEAYSLVNNKMLGHYTQSYMALGNLYLDFKHNPENVSNYARQLDLSKSEYSQTYTYNNINYKREAILSYPDKVMAVRLTADKPGSISFTASFDSQIRYKVKQISGDTLELNGIAPIQNDPNYDSHDLAIIYDESDDPKGLKFAARLKIIIDGGKISPCSDYSDCPDCKDCENSLTVENADSAVLLLATGTSFAAFDKMPDRDFIHEIENSIARAAEKGYDKLFARHVKDYENLFGRVKFDLGTGNGSNNGKYNENYVNKPTDIRQLEFEKEKDMELVALYFQFGRYLLISSSRGDSFTANLQGIWCDEIKPPWSSNLTTNINTEMNYWLAENTNLPECHRPLFHLLNDLAKHGARTAQIHYGCRGFTAAHNVDVWAHSAPAKGNAVWAYWPLGGAWMALHIFDHYLFTKDYDFLKRYYHVLHDAALFCYDWLYMDKEYNKYMTSPATSPENMFVYVNETGEKKPACVSKGSTCDMAIIRQLFTDTIQAAGILGTDTDFIKQLEERLENLFPYQISPETGRLMEWYRDFEDNEPGHRHLSHLLGVYPGTHVTKEKMPDIFEAARTALEIRLANGSGHTGWSCSWVINLFARLKSGNRAYDYVKQLLSKSTYPNLFDAHPPFQIDGNFGGTAGIAEMLLQSHEGVCELLPALPDKWAEGKIKGLRARGNLTVDISWENNKLTKAVFYTEEDINSIKIRYDGKDYDFEITPFEKNIFKI